MVLQSSIHDVSVLLSPCCNDAVVSLPAEAPPAGFVIKKKKKKNESVMLRSACWLRRLFSKTKRQSMKVFLFFHLEDKINSRSRKVEELRETRTRRICDLFTEMLLWMGAAFPLQFIGIQEFFNYSF